MDYMAENYRSILNAVHSGDGFWLSCILGALTIAFYSKKRLQVEGLHGEEYDFVRLISLPALVGRGSFRRSYLIYTISLETFYILACLSKPLFPNYFGNIKDVGGVPLPYEGTTWPLTAALVLVGLLPSMPIIDQIEAGLRQFALAASDIPDEFFRKMGRLSKGKLKAFLEQEPIHRRELDRYRKVYNLVLAIGCTPEEAHDAARRVLGGDLFSRWTLEGDGIWSPGQYERLSDVFDLLKPKDRAIKRSTEEMINATASSSVVRQILAAVGAAPAKEVTEDDMQQIAELSGRVLTTGKLDAVGEFSTIELDLYRGLADRWREKSAELGVTNRRLCGVFSVLASNDRVFVKEYVQRSGADVDIVLKEMLILLENSRMGNVLPVYNASALASIGAFSLCLIAVFIHKSFYPGAGSVGPFIQSIFTAATLSLACLIAGMVALFIRNTRVEQRSWIFFTSFWRLPVLQYKGIVIVSAACAFVPFAASTLLYTVVAGDVHNLAELSKIGTLSLLVYFVLWSMIPASFSIALCCLTDCFSQFRDGGRTYKNALVFSVIVVSISFFVHETAISINLQYRDIFWSAMTSVTFFVFCGLMIYCTSLREHDRFQNYLT